MKLDLFNNASDKQNDDLPKKIFDNETTPLLSKEMLEEVKSKEIKEGNIMINISFALYPDGGIYLKTPKAWIPQMREKQKSNMQRKSESKQTEVKLQNIEVEEETY